MNKVPLQIRVNPDIKAAASKTSESLGLSISDAINVFLTAFVRVGGFPFDVKTRAIDDEKLWTAGVPLEEVMKKSGITAADLKGWEDVEIE